VVSPIRSYQIKGPELNTIRSNGYDIFGIFQIVFFLNQYLTRMKKN
jgi:hypothetical protein